MTRTTLFLLIALTASAADLMTAAQNRASRAAPPARPQGSCDLYTAAGAPCVAAHSTTRALYSAYNGPLYQVLRQSAGKTLDIGVVQPGGSPGPAAGGLPTWRRSPGDPSSDLSQPTRRGAPR